MAEITPMTERDIEEVRRIEVLCFGRLTTREAWERELANPVSLSLVAREGEGGIAGYGTVWLVADEAQLIDLAVDPLWRRQGIGLRLLRSLIHQSAAAGVARMHLEVGAVNGPALRLYESCGFIETGRRKAYYAREDGDALLMTLLIEA